jgi:hypothetical protein
LKPPCQEDPRRLLVKKSPRTVIIYFFKKTKKQNKKLQSLENLAMSRPHHHLINSLQCLVCWEKGKTFCICNETDTKEAPAKETNSQATKATICVKAGEFFGNLDVPYFELESLSNFVFKNNNKKNRELKGLQEMLHIVEAAGIVQKLSDSNFKYLGLPGVRARLKTCQEHGVEFHEVCGGRRGQISSDVKNVLLNLKVQDIKLVEQQNRSLKLHGSLLEQVKQTEPEPVITSYTPSTHRGRATVLPDAGESISNITQDLKQKRSNLGTNPKKRTASAQPALNKRSRSSEANSSPEIKKALPSASINSKAAVVTHNVNRELMTQASFPSPILSSYSNNLVSGFNNNQHCDSEYICGYYDYTSAGHYSGVADGAGGVVGVGFGVGVEVRVGVDEDDDEEDDISIYLI